MILKKVSWALILFLNMWTKWILFVPAGYANNANFSCETAFKLLGQKSQLSEIKILPAYSKHDAEAFKKASGITEKFFTEIQKNSRFKIPESLKIHTVNFEYSSQGVVKIQVQKEGYKNTGELLPGIYHELGHALLSNNLIIRDGKTHRQIILEIDKRREEIRRLIFENNALSLSGKDDYNLVKKLREEDRLLMIELNGIMHHGGHHDELFADLTSIIMLKDPESMKKYLTAKAMTFSENPVAFRKYLSQRDITRRDKVIYYNGSTINDDSHIFFIPTMRYLHEHYLTNPKYENRQFEILESVFSAIQEERGKSKDFINGNRSLIQKIDAFFNERPRPDHLEEYELVSSLKLL